MRDEDRVTLVFFGDGAVETGVFYESLNFATLKQLPVVFVCENNLYSVYSPLPVRQPEGRPIAGIARSVGIESIEGDGNDAQDVHRLCAAAGQKARSGAGPTFLEFATYRWREHCGPEYDNHIGYRSEAEYLAWKDRCPVALLEARLLAGGLASRSELDAMAAALQQAIDAAVAFARESPFPDRQSMSAHVTAEHAA